MATNETFPAPDDYGSQRQRYFWRNYTAHIIEGGLFMGALAFLNAETVMPVVIQSLGGPNWLVALMPSMIILGFAIPPLLTAHWIERLAWMKPYVIIVGIFQRLPYLPAAIALLFFQESHPLLTLTLVALAPFASGLCGGLSVGAWLQLVSRIIPPHRLSSGWAFRFIIGAGTGILAGEIIRSVLAQYPGAQGFGILHLITTGMMLLSLMTFFTIREIHPAPSAPPAPLVTLRQNLVRLPQILREDRPYRLYIFGRMGSVGLFILLPFLSLYVLRITGQPESFVGILVTIQMIGGIFGNVLAGYLGDRFGGRLPVMLAQIIFVSICLTVPFIAAVWAFGVLYFVLGMAFFMNNVGLQTLNIELAPSDRRPTYVAVVSVVSVPCLLAAAALSAYLHTYTENIIFPALAAVLVILFGLAGIYRMPEPRGRQETL